MIRFIINNNTTKVSGDQKPLNALYQHLRFKHPQAFYIMKKVKYGWDGYVDPLSKTGVMKTGLIQTALDYLVDVLEIEDYEIIDYRKQLEVQTIPTEVGPLSLTGKFSYQKRVIESIVYNSFLEQPHGRGIVLASMNAGKTPIMFGVHMAIKNAKTIILLNNTVLYKQMKKDLKETFPTTYGYMQGKNIKWGDIMVVMVQTLSNRLKEYEERLQTYNILLTDECDLAANKTFETVYRALQHIPLRAGFTGTAFLRFLKKDALRNNKMLEIFGSVLYNITMKDLEDLGVSTPIIVKLIQGNRAISQDLNFKEEWDERITYNTNRHEVILKRIKFNLNSHRKHIMVFCRFIAQVEETYNYLSERLPKGYSIAYAHHKSDYSTAVEGFKVGTVNVLVCSLFLKRGLNLPLITTIINAAGGEYYSAPLQIAGRGVRKHKSKSKVYLEDILDNGKYLSKHSRQRIQYYKAQNLKLRDLR